MISAGYLIVCVILQLSFDQTVTFFIKTPKNGTVSLITIENQDKILLDYITPYWNTTYNKELEIKQRRCRVILHHILKRSGKRHPMRFKLLKIIPSPVNKKYRNKDAFIIGNGVDGNLKTVGLLIHKTKFRKTCVIPPRKVSTIKNSHKRVAQVFEDFIRLSPVPASHRVNDGGHWRSLLVRSNEAGTTMASVVVQSKRYSNETISNQQQALKEYFLKYLPNITLYHHQCYDIHCDLKEDPVTLLYGKPYLLETLRGYKFKIKPETFFPTNKLAAEALYDTIISKANLRANTTVLDLCKHTGIMSIVGSKYVREMVLISSRNQTIQDAKDIAHMNNIHNIKFVLGGIKKSLKSVLRNITEANDVVAIINYKKNVLGLSTIRTIRFSPQITRVIYVASKSNSSVSAKYVIGFCSKKYTLFRPFKLEKAIAVDELPQTNALELLLSFKRRN